MAVEDPSMPCGVKLVIEDYPYAADGLLMWGAIKDFVESYVEYFYSDSNSISSDIELGTWWNEIKNKGHYDKRSEPWWPKLENQKDLSGILTTMIWIASGQHAAIQFGQYPFGGIVPNRPAFMQKLIPEESDPEYQDFLLNPEDYFLSSLSTESEIVKAMPAVQNIMGTLSHDEEYIHQLQNLHSAASPNDPEVLRLLEKFSAKLEDIERIIDKRNKDTNFKNRNGAGIPPYELFQPSSTLGGTRLGIPNSISI